MNMHAATLAACRRRSPRYCCTATPTGDRSLLLGVRSPICYECMTPAPVGLRCPEHSGQPQGIQRVTRPAQQAVRGSALSRPNIVTLTLIAVNVGVYLLELAIGGSTDGTNNWIYEHGALVMNAVYGDGTPAGVANGEWWRMVSAAFLHFGPIHLLLNMYSLYYAGRCWSR